MGVAAGQRDDAYDQHGDGLHVAPPPSPVVLPALLPSKRPYIDPVGAAQQTNSGGYLYGHVLPQPLPLSRHQLQDESRRAR